MLAYLFTLLFNIGLTLSLIFGGMLLARPLTNRVLRPRQRAQLWYLGWYMTLLFNLLGILGYIPLHFTFRAFLSARTYIRGVPLPAYVPDYEGPGRYNLSLPGNAIVPVTLTDGLMAAAGILWVLGFIAVLVWSRGRRRELRVLERAGEEATLEQLGVEDPELKTLYDEKLALSVYLCGGLPTSYVREGFWGKEYFIYLQRDLPPQRLALVLRHELKHIRLYHVRFKLMAHIALTLFWWSPLVWLAFRVMCRDMELACDEAVMDDLDESGRREYVRAIAELGAGRPLWESAASFGECDALLRARRAAGWRRAGGWEKALSWTAFALLFVFFYCGSPAGDSVLIADKELKWEQLRSREVVELPSIALDSGAPPYLGLTEIWTDPGADREYGLDVETGWWSFQLGYLPSMGDFYVIYPTRVGGAPELSGLERVK